MKIFSWVHRKFQNNVPKDKPNFGDTRTAETPRSKDSDTRALLKEVALVEAFDGWKDGILSIGTLGFDDPLKPLEQQKKDLVYQTAEEEDDDDDSEKYFTNEDDLSDDDDSQTTDDLSSLVLPVSADEDHQESDTKARKSEISEIIEVTKQDDDEIRVIEATHLEGEQKKKGERITLADLFLADSDVKKKSDRAIELKNDVCTKTTLSSKNSKSFAKKLIGGGDNSQPIKKKFNQLMKRMLKRKIHPDLGAKVEKTDAHARPSILKLTAKHVEASDSISLLQTQGVDVSPKS